MVGLQNNVGGFDINIKYHIYSRWPSFTNSIHTNACEPSHQKVSHIGCCTDI